MRLTAKQEKLQATRDIFKMRADILCVGAAVRLSKSADNLTGFDQLRDFINTEVATAVDDASRAEKRYDESFRPTQKIDAEYAEFLAESPRARNSKAPAKSKPKTKKAAS